MQADIAVSPEGNVYLTYQLILVDFETLAFTGEMGVITKYDTAGHFIWSRTINDAPLTIPSSIGLGLDANENVYVDVTLSSNAGEDDGEIVKYDPNGNRLASFGRGQIGRASGFHVDPDGACYFSGFAAAPSIPSDLIVAKFNPDHSLAYLVDITKLEGVGGAQIGEISAITSDSAGDAFVLQRFDNTGPNGAGGTVISVLKLNPLGQKLFATRFNSHSDESGFDSPVALAVSPSGDAYVTGTSTLSTFTFEFVTIKYDQAGVRQWVAQYAGTNQEAEPVAMALSANNLIVTGPSFSNREEWATIAYVP